MSSAKFVTISIKECYESYQKLQLGADSQKKRLKWSKDEVLKHIEDILIEHDVKILPKPKDEINECHWNSELKRIYGAFLRMKEGIKSRKFTGNFYDSRNFTFYATIDDTDKNSDPSFQVRIL